MVVQVQPTLFWTMRLAFKISNPWGKTREESSLMNKSADLFAASSSLDENRFLDLLPLLPEVQCGDPMSVKDGFIEVSNFKGKYVFGSLATYHCNPGYILWGNASRLCAEDGTWTGVKPQCKPITCGQPPEVSNTRFQLMNGSTSWQSLARYTCIPGHSMVYEKRKYYYYLPVSYTHLTLPTTPYV